MANNIKLNNYPECTAVNLAVSAKEFPRLYCNTIHEPMYCAVFLAGGNISRACDDCWHENPEKIVSSDYVTPRAKCFAYPKKKPGRTDFLRGR